MIGGGLEVFAEMVRTEERHAAGPTMQKRGLDRPPQIGLRRHVAHGVMDEDRVELPRESHRAHVAFDMLAFRIQRAADRSHAGGRLHEDHLEPVLQMRGVVAAAAAELQHGAERPLGGGGKRLSVEFRFLLIIGRRREQRPP
jgi:hypothetical protein